MKAHNGPRVRSDCLLREMPDSSAILVELDSGTCYALNQTGAEVWGLCDGRRTVDEIAAVLLERYDADPEQLKETVEGLISHFRHLGLMAST